MQNKHLKWLWLSLAIIIIDQATKYWAEHILGRTGLIKVLPVFDFSLAHNTGAAFGFLSNSGGWQHVFFVSLAVVISVAFVVAIARLKVAIAYTLVIGGALGNAIDRVIYQYVVDFIHWFYKDWHYPHFNVADMAIFLGAALLITEAFGKPFLNEKEA